METWSKVPRGIGVHSSGSLGWSYSNPRLVWPRRVRSREVVVSNPALPWFVEGLLFPCRELGVHPDLLGHRDSLS